MSERAFQRQGPARVNDEVHRNAILCLPSRPIVSLNTWAASEAHDLHPTRATTHLRFLRHRHSCVRNARAACRVFTLGPNSPPGTPVVERPVVRPAKADVSEPLTAEPPKPEPLPEIPPPLALVVESEPPRNQHNYRITGADCLGSGSLKAKCRDNLTALELLKRIEDDDRRPTPAEKRVLVRYVGWGGLPQVFDSYNDDWAAERERLDQLLTPEEWESARATTLNAHYTAPGVVSAMYDALPGRPWPSNARPFVPWCTRLRRRRPVNRSVN